MSGTIDTEALATEHLGCAKGSLRGEDSCMTHKTLAPTTPEWPCRQAREITELLDRVVAMTFVDAANALEEKQPTPILPGDLRSGDRARIVANDGSVVESVIEVARDVPAIIFSVNGSKWAFPPTAGDWYLVEKRADSELALLDYLDRWIRDFRDDLLHYDEKAPDTQSSAAALLDALKSFGAIKSAEEMRQARDA